MPSPIAAAFARTSRGDSSLERSISTVARPHTIEGVAAAVERVLG